MDNCVASVAESVAHAQLDAVARSTDTVRSSLTRNTVVCESSIALHRLQTAVPDQRSKRSKPIQLDASANIFDADMVCIRATPAIVAKQQSPQPKEAEATPAAADRPGAKTGTSMPAGSTFLIVA